MVKQSIRQSGKMNSKQFFKYKEEFMEVKKTGKGLKVLVGMLAALLIAAIGYIVVDKFILNKD